LPYVPHWGFGGSACWGSDNRVFIVIVCYLDDSGTDGEAPIIVMAGYVAIAKGWKRFEKRRAPVFREHGIETFHAKQFHDRKEAFKDWEALDQLRFLTDWNAVIALPREEFRQRRSETPKVDAGISIYAQCFRGILENLVEDREVWPLCMKHGISFVPENGNHNNETVAQVFHKLQKNRCF
jgi:hypothetical protein